jgi:hypothetical protein
MARIIAMAVGRLGRRIRYETASISLIERRRRLRASSASAQKIKSFGRNRL